MACQNKWAYNVPSWCNCGEHNNRLTEADNIDLVTLVWIEIGTQQLDTGHQSGTQLSYLSRPRCLSSYSHLRYVAITLPYSQGWYYLLV